MCIQNQKNFHYMNLKYRKNADNMPKQFREDIHKYMLLENKEKCINTDLSGDVLTLRLKKKKKKNRKTSSSSI